MYICVYMCMYIYESDTVFSVMCLYVCANQREYCNVCVYVNQTQISIAGETVQIKHVDFEMTAPM